MHLYVELWSPRPAWLDLSPQQRQDYVAQVGPGIGHLEAAGVTLVGFAVADDDAPHDAGHRYLAAWTMPGPEQAELLERTLDEAGWHDLFEQVNARGAMRPPPEVLADMVAR